MAFEVKTKVKKQPKTREVFVVQGNYGSKWEDVTEETSYFAGRNRLKEYNDNESYPHRIITRRVPFFELSESDKKNNEAEFDAYLKRREERRKQNGIQSS
jgi:hypothetical protein